MFEENRLENPTEKGKEEEPQEFSSKVSLEFFRHDEKEKTKSDQPDQEVALTEKGRKHARSLSKTEDISQAVAFGSPFRRAKETAAYVMGGEAMSLTGNESLEDLKKIIDTELKVGTKISADPRLGFNIDKETPYGREANAAFGRGEWLKFLVEKSDQMAGECGDNKSSTYSRMATDIAKIVEKYLTIAPRFDSLVREKGYNEELKRFFGSHLGVLESFLAKVIEKTKGEEELDHFVKTLKNQGFGFSEGFKIDIENPQEDKEPVVKISYEKKGENPEDSFEFDEKIDPSILQEIIKEGSEKESNEK